MKRLPYFLLCLVLLSSCFQDDDPGIPSHFNFQSLGIIDADFLDMGSGMVGSTEDNTLYIAHRSQRHGNVERIARFNLSDNTMTERLFGRSDFVTKRLHLVDGDLVVVGGSYINTYDQKINDDPVSIAHGGRLTRFGSFMYEGDLYIFGGDLEGVDANKIKRWDTESDSLITVAILPENRFWTNGEVVNDQLFIFGGQQAFEGDAAEDEIFIVDLQDFSMESLTLPEAFNRAFTASIGTDIFVAGQVWGNEEIETRIGIFDTHTRTFREVTFNLNDNGVSSIYGLASVGRRLYVIHGDSDDRNFKLMELFL